MADEQYRWLNGETAERLLRGEALDGLDASARGQAERLAKALAALSAADVVPTGGQLPGEEAALAAFRAAREATAADAPHRRGLFARRARPVAGPSDVGLVRIGTPPRAGHRPRRPVRLALAAVLAAGMVGGVAAAAVTGVLPSPFGDDSPEPASSVSVAATPAQPTGPSSPRTTGNGTSGAPTPDGTASGTTGAFPGGTVGKGNGKGGVTGPGHGSDHVGAGWKGMVPLCRSVRDGKALSANRARILVHAAGGSARVRTYCDAVLAAAAADGSGSAGDDGKGDSDTQGGQGGQGDGHKGDGNDHHGDEASASLAPTTPPATASPDTAPPALAPVPPAFAPLPPLELPKAPTASPSRTYAAL